MKPTLQLNVTQQLSLTPQLQQAIKLLQLSTLELQETVQAAILENPMLELASESEANFDVDKALELEKNLNLENLNIENANLNNTKLEDDKNAIEALSFENSQSDNGLENNQDETQANWDWDGVSFSSGTNSSQSSYSNPDVDGLTNRLDNMNGTEMDLASHLLWQMQLTPFSDTDMTVAVALIDAINEDGYLTTKVEEIQTSLLSEFPDLEVDEVTAVLHRIQQFDPIGVGARDLKECLSLQISHLPENTPLKDKIVEMISLHLPLLAQKDLSGLKRRLKLNDEELKYCIQAVQALNPRPGADIGHKTIDYIVPDIFVYKLNDKWHVELNPISTPHISINSQYSSMIKRQDMSKDNQYLKDKLQEARWFIKSLENRNETIIKVANCIVEHQEDFLELGLEFMKPLVLSEVAQSVGVHESTVSRVTTNKYMHTPRGTFELKYFFSSHVGTKDGGVCSATAIQAYIQKWVDRENKQKPLSDSEITNLLMDKGIQIARRTIAKYREQLGILPSHERKKLF